MISCEGDNWKRLFIDNMVHRHKISKANNIQLGGWGWGGGGYKILKLWGEEAIAGVAIFLSCGV